MEQVVSKYQSVQGNIERQGDQREAEEDQQKKRELLAYQDSDDMWVFPARLPAEEGSEEEGMTKLAPDVDSNTCVTQWRGESCDYTMAMDGLLRRGRGY